jgi:hypothetical protein
MRRRAWFLALLTVLAVRGAWAGEQLSFTSTVDVAAGCNEVWTSLTEFSRLQKLVPHLHGTANVARASKLGDTLFYTLEKKDGTKNTGKFVVTELDPGYRLQTMVQPDEGPWLRVQEWTLYVKPPGKADKKDKGDKDTCHVTYAESFNELALKYQDYDATAIVKNLREPYMQIVLRRLKNISEGKDPGPPEETQKLADVAKNFP